MRKSAGIIRVPADEKCQESRGTRGTTLSNPGPPDLPPARFPDLPALFAADYLDQVGSINRDEGTPEPANQHKAKRTGKRAVVDLQDQGWAVLNYKNYSSSNLGG